MSKRKFKGALIASSLLVFSAIAVGGLAACSPSETPVEELVYNSLAISNKTDLQAEWKTGGSGRKVNITATDKDDAAVNITEAIANKDITITSSNTAVVTVLNQMLTPLTVGKSTITVSGGGKTDTVEVTVIDGSVEPSVITNKTLAEVMALDADDTQLYEVEGYITSYASGKTDFTKYGNFMISTDAEATDSFLVYGCTGTATALAYAGGKYTFTNPQDWMTADSTKSLVLGDKVKIKVYRLDYGTTKELNGVFLEKTGHVDLDVTPEPDAITATITELAANTDGNKKKKFITSGTIKEWAKGTNGGDYGNFTITDGTTDMIVYGATATATALVWIGETANYGFTNPKDFMTNEATKNLVIGQAINMTVTRCDFTNKDTGVVTKEVCGIITGSTEIAPTEITIAADKTELVVDEAVTVSKTTVPAAISVPLTFVSSEPTIASVDATGKVTALAAGTTKITAKYGEVISNEINITVAAKIVPTAIVLSTAGDVLTVEAGKTLATAVATTPEVINVPLTYVSSNEEAVTVDESGVLTGVGAGSAKITAKYGEVTSNEITITVTGAISYAEKETYTMNFATLIGGATSSKSETDVTKLAENLNSCSTAETKSLISTSALTSVFYGANGGSGDTSYFYKDCFKIGTSKNGGAATLNFAENTGIAKVEIYGLGWTTKGSKLSVNGSDAITMAHSSDKNTTVESFDKYSFTFAATDSVALTVTTAAVSISKIVTYTIAA
ncbi:MAG: Ig-like domain-containing protein [Erysipelotrichaceae bacterium]|nr:Ig-like domain-containing protein [Erysipelotrichaceae bacterium]